MIQEVKDIIEVPYAVYDKNMNDELPLSVAVVVIPRQAIKIASVNFRRRDTMLTIYKCIFITIFTIPVVLVLISFFTRMP
jgi:hypothetical protein